MSNRVRSASFWVKQPYCTRIVKIENQGLVDATPKKVENEDK